MHISPLQKAESDPYFMQVINQIHEDGQKEAEELQNMQNIENGGDASDSSSFS